MRPPLKPDYTVAINLFLDELTAHEPKKRLEHHLKAWPMLHDKEMRYQKGDTPKKLWDRMLHRRTLVLQQHVRELRAAHHKTSALPFDADAVEAPGIWRDTEGDNGLIAVDSGLRHPDQDSSGLPLGEVCFFPLRPPKESPSRYGRVGGVGVRGTYGKYGEYGEYGKYGKYGKCGEYGKYVPHRFRIVRDSRTTWGRFRWHFKTAVLCDLRLRHFVEGT